MTVPAADSDALRRALVDALLPVSPGLVYDPVSAGADPAPLELELRELEAMLRRNRRVLLQRDTGPIARPRPRDVVRTLTRGPSAARYGPRIALVPALPLPLPEVRLLLRRARTLQRDAELAIRRIERNRRFRDVPIRGQTSLYQEIDAPRLARTHQVRARAARVVADLVQLLHSTHATPHARTGRPPPARRETALRRSASKSLPELYERWLMVQVVHALVRAGFTGGAIQDAFAPGGSEYLADFDSDAPVRFDAGVGRTLVVHFEPWVHPRELAIANAAPLYRAGSAVHSWRPDLVVHLEAPRRFHAIPAVSAAIVIDAKLGPVIGLEQWHKVQKYREIRASYDDARVVRHVCIATPGRLAAAPAHLVHGASLVPELLRLSPLPHRADATEAEVKRLVALVEELLSS